AGAAGGGQATGVGEGQGVSSAVGRRQSRAGLGSWAQAAPPSSRAAQAASQRVWVIGFASLCSDAVRTGGAENNRHGGGCQRQSGAARGNGRNVRRRPSRIGTAIRARSVSEGGALSFACASGL